jgi:histidyl-tRNA synthetase
MEPITAPRGTKDILPGEASMWESVEGIMRGEAEISGFHEIRTPVFEDTRLFRRSVGETTDVVEKEMYTFEDKGGRSITLKPEGTAGAVRAYLQHSLYNEPMPVKLYYVTPCYRYERAQAGRLREFHQFGVEMFGSSLPMADAGLIAFACRLFERLCIKDLKLKINSIGCPKCRAEYTKALKTYFVQYKDELCETCQSRLERNPMRILDCKEKHCGEIAKGAPQIMDYLCDDCRSHFEQVRSMLDSVGIKYEVDTSIVRGLDYYTRTVFEFVSDSLGAQSTVCGGGRYDGLVEEMGGKPTPALGFAIGIERLLMVMLAQKVKFEKPDPCELFVASIGEKAHMEAFRITKEMQDNMVTTLCDEVGRSLKMQMKYADKIGALYSLVIGDDEVNSGKGIIKNMKTGEKTEVKLDDELPDRFFELEDEDSGEGEDDDVKL